MDEQTLIGQNNIPITSFFKRLVHRFLYGNTPEGHGIDISRDFSASWGLPFDSHPGPINEAIVDAKNLNRSLFVFIYCRQNVLTNHVIDILRRESVAHEIQQSFLFLPLDVTTTEGIVIANSLQFHTLPMIALVRPRDNSLERSQIFVKHEGQIGESILLSYIRVEHHEERPREEREQPVVHNDVIEEQDHEYQEALRMERERQRIERVQEEEEDMKEELESVIRQSVDEAFNALPPPPTTGEKATVKFILPNNSNQVRTFPRDGPTSMLFTFARKFVFPQEFIIKAGFPPVEVQENGAPLSETIRDKQFIAYVELY